MTFKKSERYNKTFPVRKSLAHLNEFIAEKRKQGWELKGEIKQNYNGYYQCMMVRECASTSNQEGQGNDSENA